MFFSLLKKFSSFTYLNMTQFLGALNDNIYKFLTVYFLIGLWGIDDSPLILATTGAVFVLPFLLFSASSGILADRFSKRNIIVLTKIFELVIMALAVLCFAYESVWGSYIILFLLALQSAVFSPSKYGIIPELVSTDKITRANGIMSMSTFLAIICGTFFASFLIDFTDRNFIFASLFCTMVALVGMITSFCIEYTPPSGSTQRFNIFFLGEIYSSLKIAKKYPSLLAAIFGSGFFLFLGSFVQLNMIPFAAYSLGFSDVQGGYLFLLTALGIGTGSMIAAKISGNIVELGLVPIAGVGVVVSCYLLDYFSGSLFLVIPLVVIVGAFGGMYQVPLDSYVQVASPNKSRGQIIAATNFLSFIGVLLSSGLIYLIGFLNIDPDHGFTIVGTITLGVTVVLGYQYFDYLSRFVAMVLSRLHFSTNFIGQENVPDRPAVYVCTHTEWNDTLLILGAQRRRIRFFIEREQEHTKWLRKLYGLLRVAFVPSLESHENNDDRIQEIKKALDRGYSVCLFVNNDDICEELEKLKESSAFLHILNSNEYPLIPVKIDKGDKEPRSPCWDRFLKKIRVPATVSIGMSLNTPLPEPEIPDNEASLHKI
jgi:acyl-[acyl-carrier-protein]-phospholipid O-acyltransferase/long-chain-fatty-acid--[acyl-carrier-protein] ligase